MNKLSNEMLLIINGGNQNDYDFGYTIGRAAKKAWNFVCDTANSAWNAVKSWF